jgi:ferredoxin-NADP reductase
VPLDALRVFMLQQAHIVNAVRETPRTVLLHVALDEPLSFKAGQAVLIGAPAAARRPYSIAVGPTESAKARAITLLVGIGDDGTPGPHLPLTTPGTPVVIEGPLGTFVYSPDAAERSVLLVAGGSGIAPLRSMLHEALATSPSPAVSLLYSARTPEEFAFDAELSALAQEGRLKYRRTATREADPSWHGDRGRISRAHLEALVDGPDTLCFVCGPAALVHEVPRMLGEIGIALTRIRVEEWALPRAPAS